MDVLQALYAEFVMPLINEAGHPAFWVAVGQIIGIDILLAGDNAVVIALACRMLPPRQRFWGMILGAGVAILMRVLFTLVVTQALAFSFLKIVGGLALVWIAVKLLVPPDEDKGPHAVRAATNLWRAVQIVAIADIVMSLDNVIAIAASAETAAARLDTLHPQAIKAALIAFGLAASIPLIVAGSALIMNLLIRFPALVWVGAGILGWVAGEIIMTDAAMIQWVGADIAQWKWLGGIAGIIAVCSIGYALILRRRRRVERELL